MSFIDDKEFMDLLVLDEGFRGKPYKDTVGKTTIGIGRNLDDNPLSKEEAIFLCKKPLDYCEEALDKNIPWWRTLNTARQRVLMNMCYNMGWNTLGMFRNTLDAIRRGDWDGAAYGMSNSKWARQVGGRAIRLTKIMQTGEWL